MPWITVELDVPEGTTGNEVISQLDYAGFTVTKPAVNRCDGDNNDFDVPLSEVLQDGDEVDISVPAPDPIIDEEVEVDTDDPDEPVVDEEAEAQAAEQAAAAEADLADEDLD